jgi:hypothetical protein
MITTIALIVGGIALAGLVAAVGAMVYLNRKWDREEAEGARLAIASGFMRLGPGEKPPRPKRCDCCNAVDLTVSRSWYAGIETFACDRCRNMV